MRYTFEWDPVKAAKNQRKHGINLEQAAEVFLDPLAVSIVDQEHSEHEDRWVTMGTDRRGNTLVLVHTFREVSAEQCKIRIISARRATRKELRKYQETQP